MEQKEKITVVLIGNPNSGKTSVYNMLVGSHQMVANFPGCTVEKKISIKEYDELTIEFIDLPGLYSLTPYSLEEKIVIEYLISEKPDLILNIIDSSNIERNLYLTLQCLELQLPTIIVLNMFDELEKQNIKLDITLFQKLLGKPVIPTIASNNIGKDELLEIILSYRNSKNVLNKTFFYSQDIEDKVTFLTKCGQSIFKQLDISSRWLSIRLLENDHIVFEKLERKSLEWEKFCHQLFEAKEQLRTHFKNEPKVILIDERYAIISGLLKETLKYPTIIKRSLTEKIDNVLLHKIFGLPILLVIMFLIFQFTFLLGNPMSDILENAFLSANQYISSFNIGFIKELLTDGIISGVGGVLTFIPQIILLFLALSVLEESGYMPRIAFVMDNLMHKLGLHGKSFIPMLIGFGCNVPAIMSARILNDEKDRISTILIIPLMSCSARLPIYILIASAFFKEDGGIVIFSFYIIGIVLSIIVVKVLRAFLIKGIDSPFIMELPPYRLPSVRGLAIHTWQRVWLYAKKAGTIILMLSIIVWLLTYVKIDNKENHPKSASFSANLSSSTVTYNINVPKDDELRYSLMGRLGEYFSYVLSPLGFDWKISCSLLAGFGAKETIISTFNIIYNVEKDDEQSHLIEKIQNDPTFNYDKTKGLIPYVFLLFILIYTPCIAVIAVVKRETNSWKWPIFMVCYTFLLAWTLSFAVYQIGKLFIS